MNPQAVSKSQIKLINRDQNSNLEMSRKTLRNLELLITTRTTINKNDTCIRNEM